MKKFGKKTLSLALAFVMVLSMCTFVSFAAGAVEITIGEEKTLTANTEREDVTWKSSDEEVATVADGVVTGVKEGTATITASAPAIEADPEKGIEAQDAFEETWTVTVKFDENADVTAFKLSAAGESLTGQTEHRIYS